MAKAPVKKYEDDALYDVLLARPITVGRTIIRPSAHSVQLKGKVVASNEADIIEATLAAL
jgi:hypothetical protein